MKKILWLTVFCSLLFGKNIVDIYRNDGIQNVERYLEKKLKSQTFWLNSIKNRNTDFGYYENLEYLMVAVKSEKKIYIYKNSKEGLKLLKTQSVIVGKAGDKLKEGDLKTPVGVYRLLRKFKPDDRFYGPFAYALSYPNTFDKLKGKSGHGIWIHGSPLDGTPRNSQSKGCIVLDNKKLKDLDKLINPKKTLLIIAEKSLNKVTKGEISTILVSLFKWRYAWKKSDIENYLDFYSDDFKRFDGKRKKAFARMKRIIFSRKEKKEILFKNINIAPYPGIKNKNIFRITFYEKYKARKYKFNGKKELYVELKDNQFKILSEK